MTRFKERCARSTLACVADTYGASPRSGSSCGGLSVIPSWNVQEPVKQTTWIRSQAKMRQGHGDLPRLEPRGVVGIDVGKPYDPVPIDDVRGRQRQHPAIGTLFQPLRVAERKIGGPDLRSHCEGDAITGGDPASRIFEDRET